MPGDIETLVPTKPYLIRAINEWCVDQGLTPYVAVTVDQRVKVPMEFVKDGQIVLNVGPDAVQQLMLGNDFIRFSARFRGVIRHIEVPVTHVSAIYARENGHGMAFEVELGNTEEEVDAAPQQPLVTVGEDSPESPAVAPASTPTEGPRKGKPSLKVVK